MASATSGPTGPESHVETFFPEPPQTSGSSSSSKTASAAKTALEVEPIEGEKKEAKPLRGRVNNDLQKALDKAKDCKTTDEFKKAVGDEIFGKVRKFRVHHDTQLESREKLATDSRGALAGGAVGVVALALIAALLALAVLAPGGIAVGLAIASTFALSVQQSVIHATAAPENTHKKLEEAEKKLAEMDSPEMRKLLARYDTVAQSTVVGQLSHPKKRDFSSIDEAKGEAAGNVSADIDDLSKTVNTGVPDAELDPEREEPKKPKR